MAAVTINATLATNELSVSFSNVQAGEAITKGMPVYRASDGKYYKASDASVATADVAGISFSAAAADEDYFAMVTSGSITINDGASGSMTKGTAYYLGTTAGTIVPYGDVTTILTGLGMADSTTVLHVSINATGVAK